MKFHHPDLPIIQLTLWLGFVILNIWTSKRMDV